jgi:hypothetical protein
MSIVAVWALPDASDHSQAAVAPVVQAAAVTVVGATAVEHLVW